MKLRTLGTHTKPDAVAEVLREDGAVIVEGVFSSAELTALKSDLDPYLAARQSDAPKNDKYQSFDPEFLPGNTRRVTGLVAKSPAYRSMLLNETLLGVCDEVLLPHSERYQLCTTASFCIDPGARAQFLHREKALWPFPHDFPIEVITMWAISEFTQMNGGTQVVPGSHLWEPDRVPTAEEIVATEMPRGSVLFFLDNTLHGAGPNRSKETRFAGGAAYCVGWLRTEENLHLGTPFEMVRTFPTRLQSLLAYDMHNGLGFVGELGQAPIDVLSPAAP